MATKNGGKVMSDQVTERQAVDALNQLLSVLVGKRFAMQTDELKRLPSERIKQCHKLVLTEYAEAVGDIKRVAQVKRKMDSLESLGVLSELVDVVDWS
jgi:cellobiose-specific phosphotransferase system component IIB